MKGKRIIVAILSGVLFGFVCLSLAWSSSVTLAWPVAVQLIISLTLIGFAIGISSITLRHWAIHGMVMGLIFSSPLAFSGLMAPESPEFSQATMFLWTVVLCIIYGLLIEVITLVAFRAKYQALIGST